MHAKAQDYHYVFKTIYAIFVALRSHHSEMIVDAIMLFLPRNAGVGPLARSPVLPAGLPNPALDNFSDEMVDELLVSMAESEAYKSIGKEHSVAEAKAAKATTKAKTKAAAAAASASSKPPPVAKGVVGKAKTKVKGAPAGDGADIVIAPVVADLTLDEEDMTKSFLTHLKDTIAYMRKLDPSDQHNIVNGFKFMAMVGAMSGKVPLMAAGNPKETSSFVFLRKGVKAAFYRYARLLPRPSDVDFAPGEELGEFDGSSIKKDVITPTVVNDTADEMKVVLSHMTDFCKAVNFSLPLIANPALATLLNNTMMLMLTQAAARPCGSFSSRKEAGSLIAESAMAEVCRAMPSGWDDVAAFLDTVRSDEKHEVLKNTPFEFLFEFGVSAKAIAALRLQFALHIIASLGLQQFILQDGLSVIQQSYCPPMVHKIVDVLSKDFNDNITKHKLDHNHYQNFSAVLLDQCLNDGCLALVLAVMNLGLDLSQHCATYDGKALRGRVSVQNLKLESTYVISSWIPESIWVCFKFHPL